MLRRAVDQHQAKAPPARNPPQTPSSSNVSASSAFSKKPSILEAFCKKPNALKPKSPPAVNASVTKNRFSHQQARHVAKDTPSQLVRALREHEEREGLRQAAEQRYGIQGRTLSPPPWSSAQTCKHGSPASIKKSSKSTGQVLGKSPAVYFEEDDFDSDYDFDVDEPITVASAGYPVLPGAKYTAPGQVEYPELPTKSHRDQSADERDSGFHSRSQSRDQKSPPSPQHATSSAPFPWSLTPPPGAWPREEAEREASVEANIGQGSQLRGAEATPQHRPTKRRRIPWDPQEEAPAAPAPQAERPTKMLKIGSKPANKLLCATMMDPLPRPVAASHSAKSTMTKSTTTKSTTAKSTTTKATNAQPATTKQAASKSVTTKPVKTKPTADARPAAPKYTPIQTEKVPQLYPWNTTASAVKEQQKTLREASKKAARTVEGNSEFLNSKNAIGRRSRVAQIFLSDEQQRVLDIVRDRGSSIFFTGSAGTGKSVLLREIIATLRRKFMKEPDRVAVTASTGLAACNIGGVTLHSFAGIGLGKETVEELVKKIKRNQKAKHRWMRTKVLIVDEISMVDGDLFDKLEGIARNIRKNGRPFGGIQLIVTGDFFQLPPVPEGGKAAKFAFDAGTWNTSIEHTIKLTKVFRQKDPEFADMLNEMREGHLSAKTVDAFRRLNRNIAEVPEGQQATDLYPTRMEVDRANSMRMAQLPGEVRVFEARDGGTATDRTRRDRILSNCMAPALLQLKVGSQVMLIKNIDETLVNGSIGTVIGFMSEATYAQLEDDDVPSSTCGAIAKFGDVEAQDDDPDLRALVQADRRSAAKTRGRLDALAAAVGPVANTALKFPYVRFTLPDKTTRSLLMKRETWKVELPNGEVEASRAQVPLILAWALSIHKAQGQTLEYVRVDLGKVFEKGQAYVALSRATSMAGLQVLRFDPRRVTVHDRVKEFYLSLSSAEQVGGGSKAGKKGGIQTKLAASKKPSAPPKNVDDDEFDDPFLDDEALMAAAGY